MGGLGCHQMLEYQLVHLQSADSQGQVVYLPRNLCIHAFEGLH